MNQNTSQPIVINGVRHLQKPLIVFYMFIPDSFKSHFLYEYVKEVTKDELHIYRLPPGCKSINFGHKKEDLIPMQEIIEDVLSHMPTLELHGCHVIHYLIVERFSKGDNENYENKLVLSQRIGLL